MSPKSDNSKISKKLLIVGSNSIHTQRFIKGILALNLYQVFIITNLAMDEFSGTYQASINFSFSNLKAKNQIFQELKKLNPDIVHIHQANSYAWHTIRAIKKLTTKPKIILTTWGSDVLILPKTSPVLKSIVKYNLLNSDLITADAAFMSLTIQALLGKKTKPIKILNFGVANLHQMVDIANKQKIILSTRLHKPLYQIEKLIRAFNYLIKNNLIDPYYRLVIAGDGSENNNLKTLVMNLNLQAKVDFVGMLHHEELNNYYQKAAIYVSIPWSDGASVSLFEAMANGCIPVLSNLPANNEWVINLANGVISQNLDLLAQDLLAAINIFNQKELYLNNIIQFNWYLIQNKASFDNQIKGFVKLYEDFN